MPLSTLFAFEPQSSHLRWRLKKGELPSYSQAKVSWLSTGAADLDWRHGSGCSEEATMLSILRAAQEVYYRNKRADDAHSGATVHVVIQALMMPQNEQDFKLLGPSIRNVNDHLEVYCEHVEGLSFFDPTRSYKHREFHPFSLAEHKAMGDAIHDEVVRILLVDSN